MIKSPVKERKPSPVKRDPVCHVPDCVRKPVKRGLCEAHYDTHRSLADPKAVTR